MTTLSDYITQVRRLLHDANANFWSDQELTDYINGARNRLVRDTGVNRVIQTMAAVTNQEQYSFDNTLGAVSGIVVSNPGSGYTNPSVSISPSPTGNSATATITIGTNGTFGTSASNAIASINVVNPGSGYVTAPIVTITDSTGINGSAQAFLTGVPQGTLTLDIVNINLYWGNSRIPLLYKPWTQFNAELRYWQNYIGQPVAYSMYGAQTFYLAPVPDQVYQMELDTVVQPTNLVLNGSVAQTTETIPLPFTEPVPFYAAYTAKYKEQSYGEAEIFKNEYIKKAQNVLATQFQRRMPNPYTPGY